MHHATLDMRLRFGPLATLALTLALGLLADTAAAELRIRDLCRVKGQEENVLQAVGLVVGLNGTGDGDTAATRALARTMEHLGMNVGRGPQGQPLYDELRDKRNVALVFITARVPAAGAREGDFLDCQVSAVSAKSLEGGQLLLTPMLGPRPGSSRVYGIAQGPLTIQSPSVPTSARIVRGCRIETELRHPFVQGNQFTLVLEEQHADLRTTSTIADLINSYQPHTRATLPGWNYPLPPAEANGDPRQAQPRAEIARALDARSITVTIPEQYLDDPADAAGPDDARFAVAFVAEILDIRLATLPQRARVTIDESTGTIVVGENVELKPVAISHRNIAIEPNNQLGNGFVPVDPTRNRPRLKDLVDALNAIRVPPQDRIAIIRSLHESGDLLGELIIQ